MPRIAVAGFQHETNTFSPIPTTFEDFCNGGINTPGLLTGTDIQYFASNEMNNATSGFLRTAASFDYQCIPIIWAECEPSNRMSEETFYRIMALIENGLRQHAPFDGVFLDLHGAMIFGDHRDGETEILARVRSIVPDIPIVTAMDLHANVAAESFNLASVMIGYRTYPHIDCYETGQRCAIAMKYLLDGGHVKKSFRQIPFLIPTSSQATGEAPCKFVYDLLDQIEDEVEIVSASVFLGFPPGDIECCGPSVLVYAQNQSVTNDAADRLETEILKHESEYVSKLVPLEQAVTLALQLNEENIYPVILADVQDNPGGGSGSDTIFIIEELLKREVSDAAVALLYDPAAVKQAHRAGEGARIEMDLGGKMLPNQSPLHGIFQVEKLFEGVFEPEGPMARGMQIDLGKMALLRIGGIYISISSKRIQAADQAVFTLFGLNPQSMQILVLKSFIHYRAAFEDIAKEIISVEAAGAEFDDPAKVQYLHLRNGMRLGGNGPVFTQPEKK